MKGYDLLIIRGGIYSNTLSSISNLELASKQNNLIYVVIDTLGGVPEIGYRTMQLLNAKYQKIYTIIPDKAMSTGTLMALGSDKIYMLHSSSLGPLDIQIEHPSDGSWISTLDVRDTMNTIISTSIVAAQRLYDQNYHRFGLSKTAAAKLASTGAASLVQPIVDKIDPYHLHKSFRSAEVGARYGATLLSLRMMKKNEDLAQQVSAFLANRYETHGYAITYEEAKNILRLSIDDLDRLDPWNEIKPIYEQVDEDKHVYYHAMAHPMQARKSRDSESEGIE